MRPPFSGSQKLLYCAQIFTHNPTSIHISTHMYSHSYAHESSPSLSHTHTYTNTYTHIAHRLIYLHPAYTAYTSHNTHILSMHTFTHTPYIHVHSHTYYTQHKHTKYSKETHKHASNKVSEVRASEAMWDTRMLGLSLLPPGLLSPLPMGPALCSMCEVTSPQQWCVSGKET